MKVTRIGLDIAKQIFELHGVDRRGRMVVRKTLRRERVLEYFSQLPACEVALEACGGAHLGNSGFDLSDSVRRVCTLFAVKAHFFGRHGMGAFLPGPVAQSSPETALAARRRRGA